VAGTEQINISNCSSIVEQQGFAIFPEIFSSCEVLDLIKRLPATPTHRAGTRNLLTQGEVAVFANDDRVLGLARSILGPQALPFRATLFDKSPRNNWRVSWHQDRVLPLRERHKVAGWGPWSIKSGVVCAGAPANVLQNIIAIRIHLDDSTDENGPLRVLPKAHLLGIVGDAFLSDGAHHNLAVSCLVTRGGIIVMRPLLVHCSSKALTTAPRRVLHVEYASCASLGNNLELAMFDLSGPSISPP
jgi:ectoine hydroxylase-related dioxygenase (phytanoyl-CoA dioxygenase family)